MAITGSMLLGVRISFSATMHSCSSLSGGLDTTTLGDSVQQLQVRTESLQVKSPLESLIRCRLTSTMMTHSDAANELPEVVA